MNTYTVESVTDALVEPLSAATLVEPLNAATLVQPLSAATLVQPLNKWNPDTFGL